MPAAVRGLPGTERLEQCGVLNREQNRRDEAYPAATDLAFLRSVGAARYIRQAEALLAASA